MSLDFQKRIYVPQRSSNLKRTTYGSMNHWQDFVRKAPDNPYQAGREGHFQSSAPILDIPLPSDQKKSKDRTRSKERRHHSLRSVSKSTKVESDHSDCDVDVETSAYMERRDREKWSPVTRYLEERLKSENTRNPSLRKTGSCTGLSGPPGVHEKYHKSSGYDDSHRTFLQYSKHGVRPSYPVFGPPRLRNGGNGGSWRHVKQVLQAEGSRNLFIDGEPRIMDTSRVLNGAVPEVRAIQNVHEKPISPLYPKASAPAHELEEFKATEQGNWMVMR